MSPGLRHIPTILCLSLLWSVSLLFAEMSPPICSGAPARDALLVLGIDGTATDNGPADTGITSVALAPGFSNLTLMVGPGFAPPDLGVVSFRVVQTNAALDARGTVRITDGNSPVQNICTVPVEFRVLGSGPTSQERVCSSMTGEGFNLVVSSTVPKPAGTTACAASLATAGAPNLPSPQYSFVPSGGDIAPSRILTIDSTITGPQTGMVLDVDGPFNATLRLLLSTSPDGGMSFPAFLDVTESVEPVGAGGIDPTRMEGKGAWSAVKVTWATAPFVVPTLSQWGLIILSLLMMTGVSIILRPRPVLAGAVGARPLFVPAAFALTLAATLGLGALGYGVLAALRRIPDPLDTAGALLTAVLLAYLVHTWVPAGRGRTSRGD